jgi:hypothetical protein
LGGFFDGFFSVVTIRRVRAAKGYPMLLRCLFQSFIVYWVLASLRVRCVGLGCACCVSLKAVSLQASRIHLFDLDDTLSYLARQHSFNPRIFPLMYTHFFIAWCLLETKVGMIVRCQCLTVIKMSRSTAKAGNKSERAGFERTHTLRKGQTTG